MDCSRSWYPCVDSIIVAQGKNLSKIKGLVQANPFSLRVCLIVSVQLVIKVEL